MHDFHVIVSLQNKEKVLEATAVHIQRQTIITAMKLGKKLPNNQYK